MHKPQPIICDHYVYKNETGPYIKHDHRRVN